MKRITEYTIELDSHVRYRVRHEIERARVLSYVVQLEVKDAQEWRPVRRSDSAHGKAHWHVYHRLRKSEKTLLGVAFNEALTHAEQEIKNHWQEFVEQWQHG